MKGYKFSWQDYVFIAIVLVFFGLTANVVMDLEQLPSPIFGGDFYNQLGSAYHLKDGGDFRENAAIPGTLPHYSPFYGWTVSVASKIFGLDPMRATIYLALFWMLLSPLVFYILMQVLLKDKTSALIGNLFIINLASPTFKYTHLTIYILGPLFILSLYFLYRKEEYKYAILPGLLLFLISISHSVGFVMYSLLFSLFALHLIILRHFRISKSKFSFNFQNFKKTLKKSIILVLIVLLISVPLALYFYWYEPIFVYHGEPLNDLSGWGEVNLNKASNFISFTWKLLGGVFFGFTSITHTLRTLFILGGIFLLFSAKEIDRKSKFIIFLFISGLVLSLHYFLTIPIFGTDLSPQYFSGMMLTPIIAIFVALAFNLLMKLKLQKYAKICIVVAILAILVFNQYNAYNNLKNDQWYEQGKQTINPMYNDVQLYILENTDVNDVILTNKEIGFALNALTGRKLVNIRASHSGLFVDSNEREKDTAIILYGNSDEKRRELLEKYSVDYFYWDVNWVSTEYTFDKNGNVVNWFDPLVMIKNDKIIAELAEYGVSYFEQHTWIDPGNRRDEVEKLDLVFVSPENYHNGTHMWSPNLDKFLSEVHSYKSGGQKIAALYEVKIE